MHPKDKQFLIDMITKYTVSTSRLHAGSTSYAVNLPDNRLITIGCMELPDGEGGLDLYYNASIDDETLDEVVINENDKPIPLSALDIINLMKLCSTKIIAQEILSQQSKFMMSSIIDRKQYN